MALEGSQGRCRGSTPSKDLTRGEVAPNAAPLSIKGAVPSPSAKHLKAEACGDASGEAAWGSWETSDVWGGRAEHRGELAPRQSPTQVLQATIQVVRGKGSIEAPMAVEIHVRPPPKGDVRVCGEVGALLLVAAARGVLPARAPGHCCFRVGPVGAVQPRSMAETGGAAAISEAHLPKEVWGGPCIPRGA